MLIIKHDPTRRIEEGQYFVELINLDPTDSNHADRLGYWCDMAHLNIAIFKPITKAMSDFLDRKT